MMDKSKGEIEPKEEGDNKESWSTGKNLILIFVIYFPSSIFFYIYLNFYQIHSEKNQNNVDNLALICECKRVLPWSFS
jgi:hypothetical protein